MKAWALQYKGKLVPGTLAKTRKDCWGDHGYWHVASALGPDWRSSYWKNWDGSIRSAARHGFKLTHVEVAPVRRKRKR